MKPIFPVFQYILQYDYITKVLCENKDIPIMGCNGKCYLMKELAKSSADEKPSSTDKKNSTIEVVYLFIEALPDFNILRFVDNTLKHIPLLYTNLYTHFNSSFVFRPPILKFNL